ncbi:MAG: ATP-binding protein [Clostridium sp.]
MLITSSNKKNNKLKLNYKMITYILIISNIIILLLLLIDNAGYKLLNRDAEKMFMGINTTMGLIAIIANYTYYVLFKRIEMLVLSLIHCTYFLIGILYILVTGLLSAKNYIQITHPILPLIMCFILTYALTKPKGKLINKIKSNEYEAIIIIFSIAIISICVEFILQGIGIVLLKNSITKLLYFVIIIANVYTIVYLIKSSLDNMDYIHGIIAISLNAFLIIYVINYNLDLFVGCNLVLYKNIFALIGYFLPCFAVFYELIFRTKREKELKNNLDIFYNITENHEVSCIILTDLNNNILYTNKMYRECLKNKEFSDVNFETINFHEFSRRSLLDYDKIHIEITDALQKNNKYKGVIKTVKGGYYDLYVQRIKNIDEDEYLLSVLTNITAEYTSIEKLRSNEEKLTTINRNIKDYIIMVNENSIITYINPWFGKRLGYDINEIVGQKSTKFYDENIIRDEIILNEKEIMTRRTLICKDKSRFEVETIETKAYKNSIASGYIVVARELELIKEYSTLVEKYREIQEYDKIREEFFANLSHEVRTPINVLYSSIQLLKQSRIALSNEEFLLKFDKYEENMKLNCLRLLRLVNNILALTKVNSGNYNFSYQTMEGVNFIEDIVHSVIPYAQIKGVSIMFDTNVEECYISIEPFAIEKVILNILSNSIKFTKEAGRILVECDINSKWFNITISDNGIGIPRGMRQVVFERFAQVNKSFNRESEGSGIGLALVKSLVELHKGKVFFNDVEEGTSITIKLPNTLKNNSTIKANLTSNITEKAKIELSDIYL